MKKSANIESNAIPEKTLETERLNLLMKITGQINSNLSLDSLLSDIIEAVKLVMECEASSLMLYEEEEDCLVLSIPTGPASNSVSGKQLPKDKGIGGWVFTNREAVIINDVRDDPRFWGDLAPEVFRTENLMCVPLLNQEKKIIGVIQALNKKNKRGFSDSELPLFQALANQAAIAIENARLHEEEKQKMLLEQKLDLARSIQTGFVPKEPPEIPGYQVAGFTKPAAWVGGDYYDFITSNRNGNNIFAVADVTGKGIPASLLMASVRSVLRAQIENDHSLTKTIDLVNKSIYRDTPMDKFITLFCGELDSSSHRFSFVNAGHTDAYHIDYENNEITNLREGGLMLGIMEDTPFEQASISLKPGQQIVIYSDGIDEAQNARGDLYGEIRFKEWLLKNRDYAPSETIDRLISDVSDFRESDKQHDDITLIVIKRNKQ